MKLKLVTGLTAVFFMAVFGFAGGAQAITITVEDNVTDNMLISAGQTVNGSFDITPALPTDGQYVLPYDISSASATFSFADDGDSEFTSNTSGSFSYVSRYTNRYGSYSSSTYTNYIRNSYDYYWDSAEGVSVQLTGMDFSTDMTDWYSLDTVFTGSTYDTVLDNVYYSYGYSCGWSGCHSYIRGSHRYYSRYQTDNYDATEGYTGGFSITSFLDFDAIEDLSFDGIIDFTVTGTTGDIIFQSGTLTAEVNPNPPLATVTGAAVPEPSTWMLLGAGFMGLAALRRKTR